MATYDLEEQERLAALKDWWDKWRVWVIICVSAFLIGVFGMHGWRYYQNSQNVEAETLMKSVQKAAEEAAATKDTKKLSEAAKVLSEKYGSTFYATDAQLIAAKASFDNNDFAAAKTHLQWVVDNGRDGYRPVARMRLASVLLDEKKYDEAIRVLDGVKEEAFTASAADLRGDVLLANSKKDEARASYQIAVEKAGDRSPIKQVAQAKLDSVGGAIGGKVDAKKADENKDAKGAAK